MPDYTTFSMPEPVAHAEPRLDREPERRNLPPIPERPAPAPEPIDRTNCNPDALATLERVEADARRMDAVGATRTNYYVTGTDGGEDWHYHEHHRDRSDKYDEQFIINDELHWRRSPTVYSSQAPMQEPAVHATVRREWSEQQAELRYQLGKVEPSKHVAPWKIAKAKMGAKR